jgi:valyl-tRNA synthetase
MNIQQMMKQAQVMQQRMEEMQDRLGDTEVHGASGGGAVSITMTCKGEVRRISISPEVINPDDRETLEDLVMAAVNMAKQQADATLAEETRKTTAWVLDQALLLLNPFMPFITEELYNEMAERPLNKMLISSEWPDYPATLKAPAAVEEMNWMIRLITEIRSVRADMNVPAAAKINLLVKGANAATQERLKTYEEIICRMARLETIGLAADAPKGAIQSVVDEATIILPIADIIDLDKERARLRKEIEKLNAELTKIHTKMADEKFVKNAPEEIIEEQRSRQANFESTLNKLSQALKQLEAA